MHHKHISLVSRKRLAIVKDLDGNGPPFNRESATESGLADMESGVPSRD